MSQIKRIIASVSFVVCASLMVSCETYYEKHNMLNNKQPCPTGTKADKYGMECKPIEVIPENESKLQKFSRNMKKVHNNLQESGALGSKAQPKECMEWDNRCKSERSGMPTRAFL